LVDASNEKDFSLAKVKTEELPAEMQKMTESERKTYLDGKTKERAELQTQINELHQKRQQYIADQMKQSGKSTDKAFDAAMLKAIRQQAERKSFTF
jgi:Skp family chaperone for outer membrane proteins